MASSIFLIAETPLFIETVQRIGKELNCTVHVAHSPAEAMLPPSGNIDLIAFEPTKEADKGIALLDILRLRYELPQSKVLIFGGLPEAHDATAIPLPLDTESFSATVREHLGSNSTLPKVKKPIATSGKPLLSTSLAPTKQVTKPAAAQPLKLTQSLKPAPLEKGTQVVQPKDVVQEIKLAQDAQLGKAVPKKPSTEAPASKLAVKVAPPGKAVPPPKAVLLGKPPAATVKRSDEPAPQEKPPPPFESTPSWLKKALGLPAEAEPQKDERRAPPPAEPPKVAPVQSSKHSLEPGPALKSEEFGPLLRGEVVTPASDALGTKQPHESTPSWLKNALGISSPSSVQPPEEPAPSTIQRDELPADFEPSLLSEPAPSGEQTPDWLAKALGIDSSESSVTEAPPLEPPPAADKPLAQSAPLKVSEPLKISEPQKVIKAPTPREPAKKPEKKLTPAIAPALPAVPLPEPTGSAEAPPTKPAAQLPEEAVEDHASQKAALEAELTATRSLLVEERNARQQVSKELEELRTEHAREVEARRAEEELVRAGQVERDAQAAQNLDAQTAKVAELSAHVETLQKSLGLQELGRNELQASLNSLEARHERELKELREHSERELRELREAHQRALTELTATHQRALNEIKEAQERATSELRAEVAKLKEVSEAKELAHTIELKTVEELKSRVAELTKENDESKNYKEKLEAALAAESLRADEIAGRLAEVESIKARTRKLADIPRTGKLTLAELASLVSQLVELQANVRLELASPTATRSLWITNGALSACTSDNEHLITLARRDELIGENQERELAALRMARPSEQREALVARGFLSTEVASALVARWTAQVAEAAFAESATTYRIFEDPRKPNSRAPEFSIPLLPLVRTALRRARPWESAAAEFAHAVLVPVPRSLELSLVGFSEEECALIESAAPTSTADELVAASKLLREQAYSCLLAAYYLDFLRIESYRDPPPPADPEIGMQRLQEKYAQVQEADYFAILGLPRTAGPDEVRRAYEVLSNEFHPLRFSTHQDPAVQERAASVWSSITEAAEALGDDRLRVEYAQHLVD